jgi:transporter family-2 protein
MYLTMAAAGLAIPVMAALSAGIGQKVGAPTAACAIFATAALAAAVFAQINGGLKIGAAGSVLMPALLGGALIAFYLLSITLLGPRIGIGTAVLLVLVGQIVSAFVIDTFGILGAPRTAVSIPRVCGIALMVVGVVLARRPIVEP